jgi:hypothetical protein
LYPPFLSPKHSVNSVSRTATEQIAMAAAAINTLRDLPHKLRKSIHGSIDHSSDSAHHSDAYHHDQHHKKPEHGSREEKRLHERETKQILSWEKDKHTLRPEEIVKRGEDKHVGFSSETLRCDDFDLLKTLGTGM